jgi:hypothetical protein
MNIAINKTTAFIATNNSGVNLPFGALVVVNNALESFTTTTTLGFSNGIVGVILEKNGIANGQAGKISTVAYVPQLNLSSPASYLDLVRTNNVAGEGVPHAAPRLQGDFAIVLGEGTNPPAILFGGPTPAGSTSLNDYILIEDQKTSGTDGGTATSGSWETRTLNTEVYDDGGHASLSSNQITLAAGTYRFLISAPAHRVNNHRVKLYNVTDALDVKLGTSEWCDTSSDEAQTRSIVAGQFTIATPKVFEVRHRVFVTQATNGYGIGNGFGVEVYTIAEFWKVG